MSSPKIRLQTHLNSHSHSRNTGKFSCGSVRSVVNCDSVGWQKCIAWFHSYNKCSNIFRNIYMVFNDSEVIFFTCQKFCSPHPVVLSKSSTPAPFLLASPPVSHRAADSSQSTPSTFNYKYLFNTLKSLVASVPKLNGGIQLAKPLIDTVLSL